MVTEVLQQAAAKATKRSPLTVSVDSGYKDYINEIKGDFEKENDVKLKLVEKDMFEQLEALLLDGPAGKGPDVMMAAYRIGALGQQGHLAEVKLGNEADYDENRQSSGHLRWQKFTENLQLLKHWYFITTKI